MKIATATLWVCSAALFTGVCPAPAALLLQQADGNSILLTRSGDQVLRQDCGSFRPNLRNPEHALSQCAAHTDLKATSVPYTAYEASYQALYGMPSRPGENDLLQRAALEAERGLRNPDGPPAVSQGFDRVLRAYSEWGDYLETGEKRVPAQDVVVQDALLSALFPLFSDGETVVRLTSEIPAGEFTRGCPRFWTPMSALAVTQLGQREAFAEWLRRHLPADRLYVWTEHSYLAPFTIAGTPAFQEENKMLILYVNRALATRSFPEARSEQWRRAPLEVEGLTHLVREYTGGAYTMPMLCFRRHFPEELSPSAVVKPGSWLNELALKYKQADAETFRRRVLQYPHYDRLLGQALLLESNPPSQALAQAVLEFNATFQPELARVKEVQQVIAQREREAALERQRQAELQAVLARERDMQRQQQARAQAEVQARRNSSFTLEGVRYSSVADYERRNPGWKWSDSEQVFIGPPEYSRPSSSYSSRYSSGSSYRSTTTLRWTITLD